MAGNDNYCFRLNEFEGNAKMYWQQLQMENDFCDVTLACEDKQITAHKLVISSGSPVLGNILKLNQTPHPLIYLTRVKYKDLQNLLNFMYQGEANIAEKDLPSFLEIAEDLNVRGLSEINTNGYKSIEEDIPQVGNINRNPPDKRKIIENESAENINDSVGHNVLKNDINAIKLIAPKTEKFNKVCAGNQTQNSISTLAVQDAAGSYPCDQCNYKTKYKSNLTKHIKAIHEGERHPCPQCDYKGMDSSALMVHIKTVHEGVRYQCDQCHFKAKYKSDLMVHIKTVHEGVRYQCDQCHHKAKYKCDLMVHIKTIHEGVRYQCDQCHYKAKYKPDLMGHIKTVHEGVRYPCDQCHYKTKYKSDLTKHIKSIHK